MRSYPTLEPVIVDGGTFVLERMLERPGEVLVGVGDTVTPDTVVARTENVDRQVTLYAANELGLEAGSLRKHLAKPIGSQVETGEVLARVRRGLRTIDVQSPSDGTLLSADDASGTLVIAASLGPRELHALVDGEVEQIIDGRGAMVRATGTRIYGIVGFGDEALGELVIGIDRFDRELTPDHVDLAWKDKIVLAGMTAGVPALNRLKDAGVAGIIIGSISESDVRRFLARSDAERQGTLAHFWNAGSGDVGFMRATLDVPFAIIVTEGFGRRPMAEPIFDLLSRRACERVSLTAATSVGETLRRPEIYVTGFEGRSAERVSDDLKPGRQVRIVDPSQVGLIGTCVSGPYMDVGPSGVAHEVAEVQIGTTMRVVPLSNLEVLV